jgi:hypothetical protein
MTIVNEKDAAARAASKRETLLRITAGAYHNVTGLANKELVTALMHHLADTEFRRELLQLIRDFDPATVAEDINTGAKNLYQIITATKHATDEAEKAARSAMQQREEVK